MKNLLCLFCLVITSSSTVYSQEAELPAPRAEDGFFVPERQAPTNREPSYERYETPRQLVHRNAALRAAQRRERLAIYARFGYSPSRPPSSTVPFMGSPIGAPEPFRIYVPYAGFVFPRPYSRF